MLVRVHELKRMVLIAHYGCAFYGERLHQGPEECLSTQIEDIRTATGTLHDWFPNIKVESYLAMRRGILLSFHRLDI